VKRTTVMLDPDVYSRLRRIARRKRTTSSTLIRDAVARYVIEECDTTPAPLEGLIGMFDGPAEPLGAETEEIVAAVAAEKHAEPGRVALRRQRP
jgi:predicted transcriptional regulator